jgi:FMN reductase
MSNRTVVGLSGNFHRPSKTRSLVANIVNRISHQYGLDSDIFDLEDFGESLGAARSFRDLSDRSRQIAEKFLAADVIVVGTPTYKGSYTGLFKHFIDLLDPLALQSKPILLTATGGSDRHALIIEHQLRPLFGFFMAHTLPTGVFAVDRDFRDYEVSSDHLHARISQAVSDVRRFVQVDHIPAAMSPKLAPALKIATPVS